MKPLSPNALAQRGFIKRKHAEGLFEVRGCWLPKALHARLRKYAQRIMKEAK